MDDRERMRFEQQLEVLLQVDVLAGAERRGRCGVELAVLLDIAPRENVFRPREVVFLKAAEKLDLHFRLVINGQALI